MQRIPMGRILSTVLLFSFLLCSQGCSQQELLETFTPKAEVEFAKNYFALFQSEDYEAIEKSLDVSLKNADLRGRLEQITTIFPKESPQNIDIVGSRTFTMGEKWQANLTFQYEFSQDWVIAAIVLERVGGGALIVKGVNVYPIEDSLQNINKFSLNDKPVIHYIFLALAVFIPLFIIVTFVVCLTTPIKKRKWLWAIFVLLGFVQCTINWSTGEFFYHLLSVNLLGAGFFYGNQFGPVMLKIAFPLGAILFWIKREKLCQQNVQQDSQSVVG